MSSLYSQRRRYFEEKYARFDPADALRIACELNIDITKPEPWLRVYYDTISVWGVGFLGPDWAPALIHGLATLIQEGLNRREDPYRPELLPEGAWELYQGDRQIMATYQADREAGSP